MVSIQSARELIYELERRYDDIMEVECSRLSSGGDGGGRKLLWVDLKSSKMNSSWYRRHRDAIASNKIKIRGSKGDDGSLSSLTTVEEKKIAIRERINKLKEQKMKRVNQEQKQQVA